MLKFRYPKKSTSVRARDSKRAQAQQKTWDITDWLGDLTIAITEDELMADLHSGRGEA